MTRIIKLALLLAGLTAGPAFAQTVTPPNNAASGATYAPAVIPAPAGATAMPSSLVTCGGAQTLSFATASDVQFEVQVTGACTIVIASPSANGLYRRLYLNLINPGKYPVILPANGGTANFSLDNRVFAISGSGVLTVNVLPS